MIITRPLGEREWQLVDSIAPIFNFPCAHLYFLNNFPVKYPNMHSLNWPGNPVWKTGEKIFFRFICIYFLIYTAPWTWLGYIPYGEYLTQYYYQSMGWMVHTSNQYIFQQFKQLVEPNGSGDTSYNWTEVCLFLSISAIGCLVWSIIDRNRPNYNRLAYWTRIFVRYTLIIHCFGYGIIKLFCLQMPFPSLSQMATPLGDYLPMRLSWMYMGYSTGYQMFSGAMEVLAGVLLLFRPTATFGTLMAAGVFTNVMVMNMSYDIPVKLFSTHLLAMCLFLLAFEYKRIANFFILNRPAMPGHLYSVYFPQKWMRVSRIVIKCLFMLVIVILPFNNSWDRYIQVNNPKVPKPIPSGIYDVHVFILNGDTIPALTTDSLRWHDMIFERNGPIGSIKTADTMFRQRYRRGYFNYTTDTTKSEITFSKNNMIGESFQLFKLRYELPDSNTVRLSGMIRGDTVYTELKRSRRHFQLSERQFHWLSEYNR